MRTKVIRQHDEKDCGAACLAMIGRHHGLKYPVSKFRELTRTDRRGANLYGLVDGAEKIGLGAEALSGTIDDLFDSLASGRVTLPFIAHTHENGNLHYVVVHATKRSMFGLADPGKGHRKLSREEFERIWTGYVVTFKKTPGFTPGNHVKSTLGRFFPLLKGQYGKLLAVLLISLAISGIGISGAFAFQLVIDGFTNSTKVTNSGGGEAASIAAGLTSVVEAIADQTSATALTITFTALLALYILQAVIQFARGYLIMSVSRQIDIRLLLSYFSHILNLPVSSAVLRSTGDYLARFSDASAIRSAISSVTVSLVLDATMVVGAGVVLYLQSGPLFWVALIIVTLYAIVLVAYRDPVERSSRAAMESNAALQSFLKEAIDGMETVKAAGATDQVEAKAKKGFLRYINSVVKAGLISVSQESLSEAVQAIGTVVVLWLGFAMVSGGAISIGSLITFYALLGYFIQPIRNLVELQPTIQMALVAADRLNDILDLPAEEAGADMGLETVPVWRLRDVDFRYGNRELTLSRITLEVRQGEQIAIVGESGSGKTTLAKLLLRFHEPESGQLLANNTPLKEIDLPALRGSIAYVNQSTFLFADSIANNLKLGNPGVTDEQIREVCRSCRADEFISRLPMGYETTLDENGANLSGGERQRLAIARALLKRPQLLILDEATSNLDTVTEAAIRDTVSDLDEELSVIIIAHRLTTVQNCDRIYVMAEGRIVEIGRHEELLAQQGKYAALWERQRLAVPGAEVFAAIS